MKRSLLFSVALCCIMWFVSCSKEKGKTEDHHTSITVQLSSCKTALGDKEGSIWKNCWKTGDIISVNGTCSNPLNEEFNGKASASFKFNNVLTTPYQAVCPASAKSGHSEGTAVITLPARQNYVAGSYDPESFVLIGKSSIHDYLNINPAISVIHLKVNGDASVSRIRLTGNDDAVLSGTFTTDFSRLTPQTVSNTVELISATPTTLPADFYICVPPGLDERFSIEIIGADGGYMRKITKLETTTVAGTIYTLPTLTFSGTYTEGMTASLKRLTSNSAVFYWTHSGDAAEDISKPYTIALYKDALCTDPVVSHDIPAGESCWSGKIPCFSFGGLEPSTKYYFRATDTEDGPCYSNVVEITTEAFTTVDAMTVADAKVGDVILSENFSEIGWGPDEFAQAAGFIPAVKKPAAPRGVNPEGSFTEYGSTGTYVPFADNTDGTRLSHDWGFSGNDSRYFRTGYLLIGTTSSGDRTHVVTPKFAGIPKGKRATVEITLTAAKLESNSNDIAVFPETGDLDSGKKMTASLSQGYPMGITSFGQWETSTLTISNVSNATRLAVGSYSNVDTQNRFLLSDISVTVTNLYDQLELTAKKTDSSSSSLVFSWSEGVSTAADIANAYTVTLYKNAACTVVDQTINIPSGLSQWNNNTPKFVLAGLKPSTTYWFKVKDTTHNITSNVVEATTDAFTIVEMPAEITSNGVALAEDFGEIRWESDVPYGAVGYTPSDKSDFGNTTPSTWRKPDDSEEITFKDQGSALGKSRLNDWVTDSNVYLHPGYLKLGTSSGKGWILTPEFTIPEGKKAIVKVTVTAYRMYTTQEDKWAVGVLTPTEAKANPSSHTADFSWPATITNECYQEFTLTGANVWATNSVIGLEVHKGDRIVFGDKKGGDSKKARVQISDLTVEVISIIDESFTAKKLSIIGDSISTFESWLPSGNRVYSNYKIGGTLDNWGNTYWGLLCNKYMPVQLKMEKNISWAGSCLAQDTRTGSSYRPAFVTRYGKENVGATYALNTIGSPDIVIIYGGTNDNYNIKYGLSDVTSTPSDSQFETIFAKSNDQLTVSSFVEAYVKLVNMVHADYPNAKIINIIGDCITTAQISSVKKISDHYSFCRYVDFSNGGSKNPKITKCEGPHPDIAGMDFMAKTIYNELGDWMLQ